MRRPTILFLTLALAGVLARPALAAGTPLTAAATLRQPVTLSKVRDLDFGTLAFDIFAGTRTVSLTRQGMFNCAANIVCTGPRRTARFNIQGVNSGSAAIKVGATSLTNGLHTIPFAADAPLLVSLAGARAAGVAFDIGGTMTVSSSLSGGIYTGTMTVTADYQ